MKYICKHMLHMSTYVPHMLYFLKIIGFCFKKLSSRAVLSKGLEFECVAINLEEQYTATEMYVAMTRAMKTIYFITDQDSVLLNAPQGI